MSDPSTNAKVEDVLSSIRRLIAAGDRSEKQDIQTVEPSAGKLVLTRSLRVDNCAELPTQGNVAPGQSAPEEHHDRVVSDQAEIVSQDAKQNGQGSADTASDTAVTPDDKAPKAAFTSGRVVALTARAGEVEDAAAAARDDEGQSDETTQDDDSTAKSVTALPWQDHTPGDADNDDDSADTLHTEAHDPFAFQEDLLDDGADAVIDEDTLRELVLQTVREELQGPLGERITRNVRKLVRREFQRVLAARELE